MIDYVESSCLDMSSNWTNIITVDEDIFNNDGDVGDDFEEVGDDDDDVG